MRLRPLQQLPLAHGRKLADWGQRDIDTSTEEGRARERLRRMAFTTLAAGLAKGFSLLSLLVSVPLTLRYLGPERYGLWMTISALIGLLIFADLGMGNGILNIVAAAHGRDDRLAVQQTVTSGVVVLGGVGALLLTGFALAYPLVDWARVFNVSSPQASGEAGPAVVALFVCFALAMPINVVQRVQTGYQEGFQSSLWQCAGSALALALVVLAVRLQAGLPYLVVAVEGAPLVVGVLNALWFFGLRRPYLWPRRVFWSPAAARRLFETGALFLVLQVAVALTYLSDNLVAAHVVGPAAVAQFAVVARMFALVTTVATLFLAPIWPAYGEAWARGDLAWVKRVLARSLWLSALLTAAPALALVVGGNELLRRWLGAPLAVPLALLAGFGVWTVLYNVSSALAMFFNGAHVVKLQVICALAGGTVALAGKIWLGGRFGLPGIVWATIAAQTTLVLVPYVLALPRILRGNNVPAAATAS